MKQDYTFKQGLKDGIPIGLGYLSVSFGFGITAVNKGLTVLEALLISMTNLTSAGQVAGLSVIVASGTIIEMVMVQFVINLRYALMSLSLSQKLNGSFNTLHRFLASAGITDEIFAVASSKDREISPKYMYGLITIPYIGWALGTFIGAAAGSVLPENIKLALGIAIYAMFVAIIVPPMKRNLGVAFCVALAAALSCIFKYVPIINKVSFGFAVIICSIIASVLAAVLFPKKAERGETDEV